MNYIFEIDEVYTFNSNKLKASGVVVGTSLKCDWKVPFKLKNNSVYYWRVRLSDYSPELWETSSFKYIAGPSEGWAQSRPPQFFKDKMVNIRMDSSLQQWQFAPIKKSVRMEVLNNRLFSIDGQKTDVLSGAWGQAGIVFCVIDGYTLQPKTNHFAIGPMDLIYPPDMWKLKSVINGMNKGDYIAIMSMGPSNAGLFSRVGIESFNQIGCTDAIYQVNNEQQILILGRKGDPPGKAIEVFSKNNPLGYLLEANIYSAQFDATVETPLIGPSLKWQDLIWDWNTQDDNGSDDIKVSLIGIKKDKSEQVLLPNVLKGTHDLRSFSTTEFPQLKLRGFMKDLVNRTAPNLDNWHILYDPAPDATIDISKNYVFTQENENEGAKASIKYTIKNLTAIEMKDLRVEYKIKKNDNSEIILEIKPVGTLPADGELVAEYSFSTDGLAGHNTLIITVNPNGEQPERNLFNNVHYQRFKVIPDKINPVLDVTVDGRRLTDGDLVSPTPEVVILANDENQYYIYTKNDTTCMEVYFHKDEPFTSVNPELGREWFNLDATTPNPKLQIDTLPGNKLRVSYKPGKLENGDYVLEVQSYDKKNNASGTMNGVSNSMGNKSARYRIGFNVINESSITNVVNYPNPFSTSTRFVYTLTGTAEPEVFQIHIYTVSGRLIKVIDLKALGDIGFGNYITQYSWDATDDFGDRLANGVYLYKVKLKMPNNQSIQLKTEHTEQYFSNGWGKMVLIR